MKINALDSKSVKSEKKLTGIEDFPFTLVVFRVGGKSCEKVPEKWRNRAVTSFAEKQQIV